MRRIDSYTRGQYPVVKRRNNVPSLSRRIIAVFVGGFLGTITRYLLSMLMQGWLGKSWPYDIFLINISGAFILAFITTLAEATFFIGPTRRLFINVGFLGAYTTFSSLALGDVQLFAGSRALAAVLYLFLSIFCGIVVVIIGEYAGTRFMHAVRSVRIQRVARIESIMQERLDEQDNVRV
ncbi:MAG TPA: fluoride efflux transporter CrcB [Ktedonobacteraceae bacterium]|jgi:CrcB protein